MAYAENSNTTSSTINVGMPERVITGVAGAALATYAFTRRRTPDGALMAISGLMLVARGVTGHCPGYAAMRTGTAGDASSASAVIPHGQGIKVEKSVTINRSANDLYDFWRNFENLPRFMNHLKEVRVTGATTSHWVAKAPLNTSVEWDAEIINELPGEMIAWRSLEGAQVPNAGSVWFKELGNDRGTEVRVSLEYNPPAGALGAAVAKLFGEEPSMQVEEDLARFKALMEAGEIPTNEGQPMG